MVKGRRTELAAPATGPAPGGRRPGTAHRPRPLPWRRGRGGARLTSRLVQGLAAGLLLAGSLAPWPFSTGAWPLGLLGAALLFAASAGPWPTRLVVGAAAGLGLYGPSLWWMSEFHLVGYGMAVLLEGAILAAALLLVPPRGGRVLAFPAALVLAEATRAAWPLGGLPLAGIELGQVEGPLASAARLGGRLLIVALVGAGGMGLALLARGGGRRFLPALGAWTVVGIVATAGVLAPDGMPQSGVVVAAVQGGGSRGIRAVTRPATPIPGAHLRASQAVETPVDLVVWPEGAVDVESGALAGSSEDQAVAQLARRLGTTVVAGVVEATGNDRFRNAAIAWAPSGTRVGRYDKVHRVPFGEYVPARGVLERLIDLSAVPRDALVGSGSGMLDTPAGVIGVMISYEVFFPERARSAVRAGAGMLVVPTNASSYRGDQVPAQELTAARLRALETGRWLVQAAPTGYSAIIDHRGRVRARSQLGEATALQRVVGLRADRTVAVWLGTAPLVAAALAGLLGVWIWGRIRR